MSAPDYHEILIETGKATVDALQRQRQDSGSAEKDLSRDIQIAKDILEPKVLVAAPAANTDNLALQGASVIHFTGATSVNLTGLVAPAPRKARLLIIYVSGAGTITLKHEVTSTATNQLSLISGADTPLATRQGAIFIYLSGLWRQIV